MDPQYVTVRILIESGGITQFKEIIEHIPAEKLAHDLNWEVSYLKFLVENPKTITLGNIKPIADLLDCDIDQLFMMVLNQYMAGKGE